MSYSRLALSSSSPMMNGSEKYSTYGLPMAPAAAPICTASPYIRTRTYCSRLSLRSGGMTVFSRITACQTMRCTSPIGT